MPTNLSQTEKTIVFNELKTFITDSIINNDIKPNIPVMMTIILHSHKLCMESSTCSALVSEFVEVHKELHSKLASLAA